MSELTEQNLTRQQAEQEMACLRKIYASVRLLDPKMLAEEPCYPPWKNVHPCTSCVGREAMAGKCQCSKLETLGSSLYQVTARYVEVDGKPYVMEMILPLDASARSTLNSNELIYRDALTGAYNRRFYEEELKHKYLNAGVAMIDLDDFKLCNDTYGHSAGDAALRLIVSIIHRRIRSTDMLVRYGGDEFLPPASPSAMPCPSPTSGCTLQNTARTLSSPRTSPPMPSALKTTTVRWCSSWTTPP